MFPIHLVLIISLLIYPAYSICNGPFNISFTTFNNHSCSPEGGLICYGSASSSNGTLSVTPALDSNQNMTWQVGRAIYHLPMIAWPASFCSIFTIRISKPSNQPLSGDGMAFIMAPDNQTSPDASFGSFMGIVDPKTEGSTRILAIEFDTFKNEWDIDNNHIGIDTRSIESSVANRTLSDVGIDLTSGKDITVQVEYNGWNKMFEISVAYAGKPLVSFLNQTLKMKDSTASSVYVGFSGATGTVYESHQVLGWNFTSIELPGSTLIEPKDWTVVYATVFPILGSLLIIGAIATPFVIKYRKKRKERLAKKREIEAFIAAANGPKLLTYNQLRWATRGFSKERLLGVGGFGCVYKGVLSRPHLEIAVKKINSTSKQGEKEYLAEICTIGCLRHKNIVQLIGWCHGHSQLLLVYEYMSNGSLDRYIGKDHILDWPTRYKILQGLASALLYLHEECGNPVVHRDVKPNNVMIDSEFNAHLGDFGLARLLQNRTSITTMIAGTPGYMAPEVSFTGRATPESDVYSFGMVLLEVICGKRSTGVFDEEGSLVEEVWTFHEKERLLDCVDHKLEGQYDSVQARRILILALACLHPDLMFRPTMRRVVQIFVNPDEPLVDLPDTRPNEVYVSLNPSSVSTTRTDFSTVSMTLKPSILGSKPD
ncbi:probable L-type lectin-domain containing receptor kinase S.5 [Impatiens glandulifera]|uniref:probable L-type lectin-domain containing receptor kinase S.5 n=1 Tax=Impatiens glandulifera TaxID=253017 RepID=UPI001FB13637|nr:probable L-type lectin-domain containing receptor kinase S.5 [Impatiens glandulifera]